jgi:hypothetical protein
MPWLRKYRKHNVTKLSLRHQSSSWASHRETKERDRDEKLILSLREEIEELRRKNKSLTTRLQEKSESICAGQF